MNPFSMLNIRNRRVRIAFLVILLLLGGWGAYHASILFRANQHYRLAKKALDRCEYKEASSHLENYLVLRPRDGDTKLLAGQTARRGGNFKQADKYLRAAQALGVDRHAILAEGNLLEVQSGNLRNAGSLINFCQKQPGSPETALVLEALIEGSLRSLDLLVANWSVNLWLKNRPAEFDQARGLVWRGRLLELTSDGPRALADYRKAVELAPSFVPARLHLTQFLLGFEPTAAAVELEWLRQRLPDDPDVGLLTARWHRNLGRPEEAVPLLDEVLAHDPERVPALLERGRVAIDLNRLAEAEGFLRRALHRAADPRDTLVALGDCLRLAGRLEEAQVYQEQAQKTQSALLAVREKLKKQFEKGAAPK